MRRSILFTVLALGAQAAWAQEATDPIPDDGVVAEETAGPGDAAEGADEVVTDESDPTTEVVTDESHDQATEVVVTDDGQGTEVATDEADDEGTEVSDDESDDEGTEVVEDKTDEVDTGDLVDAPTDRRSPSGTFHGGHHATVSTLAQAGLGRVFGSLRSQGYGDIQIERVGDEISISAARGGEVRHLVYDANTGTLLSDASELSALGFLKSLASKLTHDPAGHGKRDGAWWRIESRKASGKSKDGDVDHGGGGKGNHESTGGGHGNGSKSGGNHGNAGGNAGGHGNGGNGGGHGNGGGKNK